MNDLFSLSRGLYFPTGIRNFGLQDKGISPQGTQDQFSFLTAFNLLSQPTDFQSVEIIYANELVANDDLIFIITGAEYSQTSLGLDSIINNKVYRMSKGERVSFKGGKKGYRTIFMAIKQTQQNLHLEGLSRKQQSEEYSAKLFNNRAIRVTKGPEFSVLCDDAIFSQNWILSSNSSQMGIVLEGGSLEIKVVQMISQPVTDGTIQLSPSGPIVLMRHRQTVGGYPRVLNVIEPDVDKLSQFALGSKISLKLITIEEAMKLAKEYTHITSAII